MIEVFILSIIQGVTEFLPISSSSHLILISNYISFENQGLSIDVSLHIGSFLAVILYFKKDILNFVQNKDISFKKEQDSKIYSNCVKTLINWF